MNHYRILFKSIAIALWLCLVVFLIFLQTSLIFVTTGEEVIEGEIFELSEVDTYNTEDWANKIMSDLEIVYNNSQNIDVSSESFDIIYKYYINIFESSYSQRIDEENGGEYFQTTSE